MFSSHILGVLVRKLLTILILACTIQVSFACPNVQQMGVGDPVPCEGVFFNEKSAQELRRKEKEREKLVRDLKLTELQVENRDKKAELWEEEAKRQRELREGELWNYRKGVLYGVVGTILVFWLNSQVIKASK